MLGVTVTTPASNLSSVDPSQEAILPPELRSSSSVLQSPMHHHPVGGLSLPAVPAGVNLRVFLTVDSPTLRTGLGPVQILGVCLLSE